MKKFFLSLTCVIFFIGCGEKQCTPVIDIQEVKVPVYPNIPDIECEFNGEGLEPIEKMVECLSLHKTILDNLREKKY